MIPTTVEAMRLIHEGSLVLSKIEANGVRVNVDYLRQAQANTRMEVDRLEQELLKDDVWRVWKRRFGGNASLDSYSQLATVVFAPECLGHEVRSRTATGRAAAGKDQLDDLDIPFMDTFARYQNLKTKVLGTYLRQIEQEMVEHDGAWWVHPDYNMLLATFRSGCSRPNWQNQPKRQPEMAELIRPNFLPHPGDHFVEADFSQLEVRVGHAYHHDPNMERYIRDPTTDMHTDTAAEMFCVSKGDVKEFYKKTLRDSAKNQFVFPQFYGSNYVNCCKAIWKRMKMQKFTVGRMSAVEYLASKGITGRGDCEQGVDPKPGTFEAHLRKVERLMWDKRFRVYTEWRKSYFEDYCKRGGFLMHTGFAVNGVFGRRDVTNYPIQGSAFHCLLWVLIELQKFLKKYKLKSKIIGEIHDAVQMSVPTWELQTILHALIDLMVRKLPKAWPWITVPLDAEVDCSPVDQDWNKCKPYTCVDSHWRAA